MNNPYQASGASLADSPTSNDTYEPEVFAMDGRIGRLRYLAFGLVVGFSLAFAMGVVAAILAMVSPFLVYAGLLLYIPIIAYIFILAKRRLNDMGYSGWCSLLLLIPFVQFLAVLWLVFGPGDDGTNEYGQAPGPNSGLVIVGAIVMPIVFVGTLAAVAIPQYAQYIERARAAKQAQPAPLPAEQPAQ